MNIDLTTNQIWEKVINLHWIFQMKILYKRLNLIKNDYYIASLDCNLILKKDIKKDKKKINRRTF